MRKYVIKFSFFLFAKNECLYQEVLAHLVTLIVLLILAGVSLNGLFGAEGIFNRTREVAVKTEFAMIKEELDIYIADKMIENSEFDVNTLNAYKSSLNYNTKTEEGGNIDKILNRSKYEKLGIFEITNGKLLYTVDDKNLAKWAREMGILTNLYEIDENGVLLSAETNKTLAEGTGGTLTIPDTIKGKVVTSIGEGAFGLTEGVTKIILPRTVTTIEKNAFRGNTTLKEIELPEGLLTIGEYAFADCTSLQSMLVPDTVTDIGRSAFENCSSLLNLKLSNSMKIIQARLITNTQIEKIEIPESVIEIRTLAFYFNNKLTKIKLPSGVSQIGGLAFSGDTITTIDTTDNQYYSFTEGVLTNKEGTEIVLITKTAYIDEGKTLKIPYKVEKASFTGVPSTVNKYTLPSTLKDITNIPRAAHIDNVEFYDESGTIVTETEYFSNINGQICSRDRKTLYWCYLINNAEIELNDGIEIIEYNSLNACKASSIKIPNSVTTLKNMSLIGLINLKELSLGENISNIEGGAFRGNQGLINVTIDSNNKNYMSENGAIYTKNKETLLALVDNSRTTFTIPQEVKEIGKGAFQGKIQSVKINNGLISIGEAAFGGCRNLNNIDIPNSVVTIGSTAFESCDSLTTVTIPEGVTTIGLNAFANCSNLETIQIASTINSIGVNAFANCNKLKTVEINRKKDSISGSPWGLIIGASGIKWTGTK